MGLLLWGHLQGSSRPPPDTALVLAGHSPADAEEAAGPWNPAGLIVWGFLAAVFLDGDFPRGASGHFPVLRVRDRHWGHSGRTQPSPHPVLLEQGWDTCCRRGRGTRGAPWGSAQTPAPREQSLGPCLCRSSPEALLLPRVRPPQALIVVYAFHFPHLLSPQIEGSAHRALHRRHILGIILQGPTLCLAAACFSLFFYPAVSPGAEGEEGGSLLGPWGPHGVPPPAGGRSSSWRLVGEPSSHPGPPPGGRLQGADTAQLTAWTGVPGHLRKHA